MQTAKRFMAILFSAQLFLTAALCGGVCCRDQAATEASPEAAESKSPRPAGHCHAEASKSVPIATQAAKSPRGHAACHAVKASAASNVPDMMGSPHCACSVEGEESGSVAVTAAASTMGRDWQQALVSRPSPPPWLEDTGPPDDRPPHVVSAHSPPHTGFQLSLRI
jgi:hypothetical protein